MKNLLIIALLIFTSGAFIILIVPEEFNANVDTGGDTRTQLLLGVIDAGVVIACAFHGRQLVRVALQQPWILAFVAWSTLSVAWSDFPLLTLRRVVGLDCTMALGFFLGMRVDTKSLLRMVAWALAFTIPCSLVAGVLFPSIGIMHRLDAEGWRGVFNHKNALGSSMGIALIAFTCLLWEDRRHRWVWLLLLPPALLLLALSRSMTSTIVLIITLALGFFWRLPLRSTQKIAVYAMVMIVALGTVLLLRGRMDSVFALIGRDSSLTGRLPLWQFSASAVLQRPFLGAGWDGFWPGKAGDNIHNLVRWNAPHAHNSFIEMALNIGVIGLFLFLVCVYKCFRLAVEYSRDPSNPVSLWPLMFYTYSFLAYFTEAPAVDRHTLPFVLFCALPVSITEAFRRQAIEDVPEDEFEPLEIDVDSTLVQES